MACAWAGFAGYGVAMVLSYIIGQKYKPIDYDLKSIFLYTAVAVALFFGNEYIPYPNAAIAITARTVMIFAFVAIVLKKEKINIKAIKR